MSALNGHLKGRVKLFVERKFGLTISRTQPHPPNKHADAALLHIRRWSSRDVIFDVGANDGRTIRRISDRLNSPTIFAFEPVSSTFQTLAQRTAHLENVVCCPVALGAEPGQKTIYLSEIHEMNSFSSEWAAEPVGTEVVEMTTVDAVMEERGIDFIHFLKIDAEGYDLEVLRGAQEALSASRIAVVQVEVGFDQLDKKQPSLEEIRLHLAPMGYCLYGIYNQCRKLVRAPEAWPSRETNGYRPAVMAYCDALFVQAML